jgi:hypothetical protein
MYKDATQADQHITQTTRASNRALQLTSSSGAKSPDNGVEYMGKLGAVMQQSHIPLLPYKAVWLPLRNCCAPALR